MPAAAASPVPKPLKQRGRFVNTDAVRVAPGLADAVLASPFKRAGGMAIDLVVIILLSALAKPILGVFTGLTFASLGSRRVSDARVWLVFRWVLVGLGAGVMLLSAFFVAGTPIVRTGVFNIAAEERAGPPEAPLLSANPSHSELQRAVNRLEQRDEFLSSENKALRNREGGRSLTTAAADFGKTFGLTFGWAGVYFTLLTAWLRGRTLGKFLMGTRVVRLDGRAITPMDAFIRNGGYAAGLATGLIGFMSILWNENRQAIHDRMTGTVVVLNNPGAARVTPVAAVPSSTPPPSDSPPSPS
ncbi:MAG TPA: RDD family protein [Opitutaceae bacterium]|nr:RDD family protein [Opitutaceae bacterium]